MHLKSVIVLSGAGISAESGIKTFRDQDGLWENHDVMEVASIEGWHRNPRLVVDFYNQRREQLASCQPNNAHAIIAELEKDFDVTIITQNVDDLHERSGSSRVIHLHGELTKVCSENGKRWVQDIGYRTMAYGEKAADGSLLRPFIVWFGEDVPLLEEAIEVVQTADYLIIIGTSLNVYPAANLYHYAPEGIPIFVINPNDTPTISGKVTYIKEKATSGMEILKDILAKENMNAHE